METRGEMGGSRKGAALALLCVAQFVDVLDVNAVVVALHTIGEDLGFSRTDLQWVISAYVLSFAGFLLLAGRVADLWGRRRTFVVGLALFTGASLLCGLSFSPGMLASGSRSSEDEQRVGLPGSMPAAPDYLRGFRLEELRSYHFSQRSYSSPRTRPVTSSKLRTARPFVSSVMPSAPRRPIRATAAFLRSYFVS